MRTDTIFFQLFQTFDSLLFELVGLPPETASGYRFTSVEIKEKAFRFDGIFMPEALDKNIWFVEVQFQKRAEFYWEFIGEIFLYLSQYKPKHDWQAVAIFAKRSIEPEIPKQFMTIFAGGHIVQIYLDELPENESLTLGLVRLIVAPKRVTVALAQRLAGQVEQGDRERVVEFIETVLLYKFPQMSREEVEAMFTLGDLKKQGYIGMQSLRASLRASLKVSLRVSLRVKRSGRSAVKSWGLGRWWLDY